ncbi:MAG: hypothetical protein JWN73_2276 [Betaproteobacteria bacterium]|nr:hypothetical protein [Betaproteobacteria bacterium]
MRTALFILGGLVLLGAAVFGARFAGGDRAIALAAGIFIPVWLAGALVNMWIGVARAGYPVGEEFPIMLVIFVPPAALAGFICWKFS